MGNSYITGFDRWESWIEDIPHEVEQEVKSLVAETAYRVEADAKRLVPVDTGHLRRSINTEVFNGGWSARIGTNVEYALAIEFGSAPHTIKADSKKVLSNGTAFFGKEVQHPGNQPQPFLIPAFVKNKEKFERKLREIMNGVGD